MKIDPETHKIDPATLTRVEAGAFLVFLGSEIDRHLDDIRATQKVVDAIRVRFKI